MAYDVVSRKSNDRDWALGPDITGERRTVGDIKTRGLVAGLFVGLVWVLVRHGKK